MLVFESEFERTKFIDFVIANYEKYDIDAFRNRLPYFPDLEGYNMDAFKKDYLQSQLLQQMLKDFRIKEAMFMGESSIPTSEFETASNAVDNILGQPVEEIEITDILPPLNDTTDSNKVFKVFLRNGFTIRKIIENV